MTDVDKAVDTVEKIGSTLSSIVPQLFFDLIARLIPGFTIIWSFYLALLGNPLIDAGLLLSAISNLIPKNNFFLFTITAVVFYVTSIAFYGLWAVIVVCICGLKSCMCSLKNKMHNNKNNTHRKCEEECKNTSAFVEVMEAKRDFTLRHDFIKLMAPIAGNRITKLKAEIHMSGALTATFLLCFIISSVGFIGSTLSNAELVCRCLFFMFGAIGFFFSNQHFSKRLYCAVYSYSTLLNYEKEKYLFPEN